MRINNEFSLTDIEDEINWAVANEVNTHFIVTGTLARYIVDYLETEHEMPQFSEYEDESDKLYDFLDYEVYTISINADEDFMYFAQETYYEKPYGRILATVGGEEDIVYVESETDLSLADLKRVYGKQIIVFDLDEESHECCDCNGCPFEGECEENELDEENYALNLLLDRIENLEDRVAELESDKSEEAHFFIDDIEVTKETFDKLFGDFESKMKSIDRYLKW